MQSFLAGAVVALVLLTGVRVGTFAPVREQDAPRILLDQSPRAVEYQLNRLTNDELVRVERKTDDVKYRPVYYALLTRKGLAQPVREEALAALATMDKASPVQVLLDTLSKVPAADAQGFSASPPRH